MDVDRSIQTRQVNYMNRPHQDNNLFKRKAGSANFPAKQQRLYHLTPGNVHPTEEEYLVTISENQEEVAPRNFDESENFMEGASPAFQI